jgi:hypothetical protein
MRPTAALFTLPLLFATTAQAQSFSEALGGPGAQRGVSSIPGLPGFQVLVGATHGNPGNTTQQAELWSVTPVGQAMGVTPLPSWPGAAFPQGATSAGSGIRFHFGSHIPPGDHVQRAFVQQFTTQGTVPWTHSLAGEASMYHAAVPLEDGGVVLCGNQVVNGRHDALVVRFSATGQLLWSLTDGFDGDEEAHGLAIQGNDILLAGRQTGFDGTSDAWVARVSLSGQLLWSTSWGDVGNDVAYAVTNIGIGTFLLAGTTTSFGPIDPILQRRRARTYLLAINLAGDTLWTRSIGDALNDREVYAMGWTPPNDVLLVGRRVDQEGGAVCMAQRITTTGTLLWERSWDLGADERLLQVTPTGDGFVATGWAFGPQGMQVALVRRNANGE